MINGQFRVWIRIRFVDYLFPTLASRNGKEKSSRSTTNHEETSVSNTPVQGSPKVASVPHSSKKKRKDEVPVAARGKHGHLRIKDIYLVRVVLCVCSNDFSFWIWIRLCTIASRTLDQKADSTVDKEPKTGKTSDWVRSALQQSKNFPGKRNMKNVR